MANARKDRFEQIIALLLAGRSYTAIAMIMSCSRKQLYVWIKTPEFIALYEQTKKEVLTGIRDSVIGGAVEGMQVIRDAAIDIMIPKVDRYPIAKYLVDNALDFAKAINTDNEDEQLIPVKRVKSDE